MQSGILKQVSTFDLRGYAIVSAIVLCFVLSVLTTLIVRGRYARIARDLSEKGGVVPFETTLLRQLVHEVSERARTSLSGPPNVQAILEHHVQQHLRGCLLGERFVRAAVGLVIILGLAGTFYGLSLSIGKLVRLVAGGSSDLADVTLALTQGLTQALAGMSVAFTASLFGISTAVVLTVFGIFFNVTDRRTAVMLAIETHLSRVLGGEAAAAHGGGRDAELAQIVAQFGDAVIVLGSSVGQFQSALEGFSNNTRDFQEFNLHLKDNVQRMSLGFADLSDTLKTQLAELRGRSPRQGA